MVFYFVGSNGIAAKEKAERIRKPFAAVGATVVIRNFGYLQELSSWSNPAGQFFYCKDAAKEEPKKILDKSDTFLSCI